MKEWVYRTRLGRLSYATFAGLVALAAGGALYWIGDASGPLSWVSVGLAAVGWIASWVALCYVVGAIIGPRWEIDMSGDGAGD
jgi:hypothetical protein